MYNKREALRPASERGGGGGLGGQIRCEKSTKENVTSGLVSVLVMRNRKIRSKVKQTGEISWVFLSFFLLEAASCCRSAAAAAAAVC